jgi:hypothetical protein
MWKKHNTAGRATCDDILWRMSVARWVTKALETQSEYVIFITFPQQ